MTEGANSILNSIPQSGLPFLIQKWEPFFRNLPFPFRSLDLRDIQIKWNNRMRSRAGVCKPGEELIELNPNLLKDLAVLEDVFVHEICHMVVSRRWPYAQSHGTKWKNLMLLCGIAPKRCHDLVPVKRHLHRRWDFNCGCQIHKVSTLIFNRIRRGQKYNCRSCGNVLRPN